MPWVIDASALIEVLLGTERGAKIASVVTDDELLAPDLINAEVVSTLRRLVAKDGLTSEEAGRAIDDLSRSPVERVFTTSLLQDVWSLRDRLSAYDAQYVALARAIGCGVVTSDGRMSRAHGLGVAIVAP
jgi:predicted nucleic acid-binding protein